MPRSDLEWQVGGESGQWETITLPEKRRWLRWPRWVWLTLALVVLAAGGVGYLVVRQRFEQVNQQITFQIQSVINLEAQAWDKGNDDLFMAQQDETAEDWYVTQQRRIEARQQNALSATLWPARPAQVEHVNLQGEVAWVQVIEQGDQPMRRMRFYRQTAQGWKETAPQVAFWKNPIEYHYGDYIIFRYYHRDKALVESLVERMGKTFYDMCSILSCFQDTPFEVVFSIEPTLDAQPRVRDKKLILPSPWVSGISLEQDWGEAQAQPALYSLTYMVMAEYLRSEARPSLNLLQKALLDEYAAWVSSGDVTQSPLLGRVMARQERTQLGRVFASARRYSGLSLFLARWLSLTPSGREQGIVFFEMLLNVERESLLYGRKSTFLLLQDSPTDEAATRWAEWFDRFAQQTPRPDLLPVQVSDFEINGQHAVVICSIGDERYRTVFLARNGDWKHTMPLIFPGTVESAFLALP